MPPHRIHAAAEIAAVRLRRCSLASGSDRRGAAIIIARCARWCARANSAGSTVVCRGQCCRCRHGSRDARGRVRRRHRGGAGRLLRDIASRVRGWACDPLDPVGEGAAGGRARLRLWRFGAVCCGAVLPIAQVVCFVDQASPFPRLLPVSVRLSRRPRGARAGLATLHDAFPPLGLPADTRLHVRASLRGVQPKALNPSATTSAGEAARNLLILSSIEYPITQFTVPDNVQIFAARYPTTLLATARRARRALGERVPCCRQRQLGTRRGLEARIDAARPPASPPGPPRQRCGPHPQRKPLLSQRIPRATTRRRDPSQ